MRVSYLLWVLAGALAALSVSFGVFAVAAAIAVAVLLTKTRGNGKPMFGAFTGAGLPLLWVAYVQRQGPGTTCWRTASGLGCDQHLDPLPWLVAGLCLVLIGVVGYKWRSR